MIEPRWAVVYAKPACEMLAAKAIVEAGYRSYCPTLRQRARCPVAHRPRRDEWQIKPLFPRYLFAEVVDGPESVGAILHCTGVADLLRRDFGQAIALMPEALIEAIRETERANAFDEPSDAPRFLPQPRERVRILDGAWSRMVGEVAAAKDGDERVRVLLHLFDRRIVARVPVEMLAPA